MADETDTPVEQVPGIGEPVADQPSASDNPTTEQLLQTLLDEQRAHRAEVAQLRDEVNRSRNPVQRPASSVALSAEELADQRAEEIAEHGFYCPGCGRLYDYQRECAGRPEAPHAPIDVISTDELKGDDPSKHTAAPGVNP